jgi:D-sedoheptulose 7-phosphate isomerase
MTFTAQYLQESADVIARLDQAPIERMATLLDELRARGGRLFILGMGGGAGHASHAVNDFRKIANFETYSPCDNVSELTARANDEGLDTIYSAWLKGSRLRADDMVMVFSVGGGDLERNISASLVRALEYAKSVGAVITGIVGRDGGYTAKVATACVVVPVVNPENITPHSESFQALIWHLLVSHPKVRQVATKWESQQGA